MFLMFFLYSQAFLHKCLLGFSFLPDLGGVFFTQTLAHTVYVLSYAISSWIKSSSDRDKAKLIKLNHWPKAVEAATPCLFQFHIPNHHVLGTHLRNKTVGEKPDLISYTRRSGSFSLRKHVEKTKGNRSHHLQVSIIMTS